MAQERLARHSGDESSSSSSCVEQQLLRCVLQAPDSGDGSQPLSRDGVAYWRTALGGLGADALSSFVAKVGGDNGASRRRIRRNAF